MQISFRCRFSLGASDILFVPFSAKAFTAYRGAKVAHEICAWVNGQTSGGSLNLVMGPRARAILDDLRERHLPVSCACESSPHLDSFWTETAVVLRSTQPTSVGLRIAPGISEPQVLGYWTP
jgi:hypothetical protein